jgi:hypothetical protein
MPPRRRVDQHPPVCDAGAAPLPARGAEPGVPLAVRHVTVVALTAIDRASSPPPGVPGVGHVSYFKDTEGNILGALQPVSA